MCRYIVFRIDPLNKMKFCVFTDTHLAARSGTEQIFTMFEECLTVVKQAEPSFVLYLGDLFDTKHIDPTYVKRTKDLLEKYSMGPCGSQLLFPAEDACQFIQSQKQQIPFLQICGNHEDPAVLSLLPTQKFNTIYNSKVLPYIFEFQNTILIIWALNFKKGLNKELKQGNLQLLGPENFFKAFPVYQSYQIETLLILHQDNTKLTELFDFQFVHTYNRLQTNPLFQIHTILNGHEHSFASFDYYNPSELHVIQPGTYTQTKRQQNLLNEKKKDAQNLLICNFLQHQLKFEKKQLFSYQLTFREQLAIDCTNITDKTGYIQMITQSLDNILDSVIQYYDNLDYETVARVWPKFAKQYSSATELHNHLKSLVANCDRDIFKFLPLPQAKIDLLPYNFDYGMQLILNTIILEDELQEYKKYFAQKRIIDQHRYDRQDKIKKTVQQSGETSDMRFQEPELKKLVFKDLLRMNDVMNKELQIVHSCQAQEDTTAKKQSSSSVLLQKFDKETGQVSQEITAKITDIIDDIEFEEKLEKLLATFQLQDECEESDNEKPKQKRAKR